MECKKCGKILSEQEKFCTYCGNYYDPDEDDNINEGFSEATIKDDKKAIVETHKDKNEDVEIEKLVYENAEKLKPRCLRVFLKADYRTVTEGGFSIYAMLFSWIYFIYKKLYIIGIPGLLIAGVLVLFQPVILIIYAVLSMVLSGVFFNKIYLWYANKKIDKLISDNNPDEAIKKAKKAGNENVLLTLGIYFIFLILIIVLYFTKDSFGNGGDKYYKENTNNKNTCLKMVDAAKKNSKSTAVSFIIEAGCVVIDSEATKFQVYLKFDKGNKIIIEQYSTDSQKMYLDGTTDLLKEYESRKFNLNDSELEYYQKMIEIESNYSKLQQQAKAEDDAILNKNSIGPKSCFFLTTEEVNK